MDAITISTKKEKEIVDITDVISHLVKNSKREIALCILFIQHTTASITTADLDPGTDLDMLDAFEKIVPKLPYRHPHNPSHVPDHILSSIIGSSVTIPVLNGQLELGTWQRIVLVELDGPRERKISIRFL